MNSLQLGVLENPRPFIEAFLQNEKCRHMLLSNGLRERCGWKHSRKHVSQVMPLFTTRKEKLTADKHVIAKLQFFL